MFPERPDLQTILSVLTQQASDWDQARLQEFLQQNAELIPSNCHADVRNGELILECSNKPIAAKLWRAQQQLLEHATITRFTVLCGSHRYSAPLEIIKPPGNTTMQKSIATSRGCSYQELLRKIANTQYPAFVVEMPQNWHWGQPQRCLLTSAQVTNFSGRKAPNWHGDDVTLLYDRQEFERLHNRLMREFQETPSDRIAQVNDIEYRSYTVASDRESLAKGQEAEYRSDIEILYVPDLDSIVRICYCKERRVL